MGYCTNGTSNAKGFKYGLQIFEYGSKTVYRYPGIHTKKVGGYKSY